MIRLNKFIIRLAFGLGFILIAPMIPAQTFSTEKPLGEIESSMESNLTWNLQNALSVYYPETKFVVNAKVKLKKVPRRRRLPKLPDALLSKDLTNLPGLPYLPEELLKPEANESEEATLGEEERRGYEIEHIWVNVLLDQSLKQSDWAFIRRFVNMSANLEPERGDQVRIDALTFPEKADFMPPEKPEPEPLVQQPMTATPEKTSALPAWFPYAFAGGLALLLLALFLIGLRSISKSLRSPTEATAQTRLEPAKQGQTASVQLEAPKREEKQQNGLPDLRTAAIDAIVGTPAASANVFSRWMDEQGETGTHHVAIVLVSVSRSLLDLLEPHFGQETAEKIHKRLAEVEPSDVEAKGGRLLRQFDTEVRKQLMLKKYDASGDALSFLHQMTDDQLQHLLKPLKHGVIAIVLAQLRTNRAARLLDKMESEQRKTVLAAMGNIDRIPSDVYQHIARQLAARASELKWMRYVRANGVDTLVKVLDYFDEETQNEALDYLQTQDVTLARKVNKYFMTFNQFITMPNDKLREAAVEVDRDTLAKSLVTLDEQTVENIINSLPEKLGELVRASLESNLQISEDEVTAARRSLMRTVRSKKSPKVVT
ncbi:MAG: FliG C-terminal domain-containing protein [bacterium]